MHIPQLMIEVTRRCQLECEHCLRGDSQPIEINNNFIHELLTEYDIDSIGTIIFTGGEPFLNPAAIAYTISVLKFNEIEVFDFYIATNGMLFETSNPITKMCMITIMDLWLLCCDNEISRIDISRTKFHDNDITDNNLLNIFSFTESRGEEMTMGHIIAEGRGADITTCLSPQMRENEFSDQYPEDLMVYLNARGLLVWNCDLSYKHQDEVGVSISQGMEMVQELLAKEVV